MSSNLPLHWAMSESQVDELIGKKLDGRFQIDRVIQGQAVNVYKRNGQLLLALRPGAIPWAACETALDALRRAARPTNNRPLAAGGVEDFRSGTIGYLKGELTNFCRRDPKGWGAIQPLLRAMNRGMREFPAQYQVLDEAAKRCPDRVIPYTVFSTATVNRNARFTVHRDDGNLPGAYGAMTVIRSGQYQGGLLVFPRYRVAVDLHNRDLLIADNQEAHGNTALEGIDPDTERISVVAYFHSSNLR